MALYTHHLPAWKKDEVAEIKKNAETKMHKSVTLNDTAAIRGMIRKVSHLVKVVSQKAR